MLRFSLLCMRVATGGSKLLALAVGLPLLLIALTVDCGVSKVDEAVRCARACTSYTQELRCKGVRGVGFLGSVGMGVAAAIGTCLKRMMRLCPGSSSGLDDDRSSG